MTINLCGAICAVAIFALCSIVCGVRALRAQRRERALWFLTAFLNIALGVLIVVFYTYNERVLFRR